MKKLALLLCLLCPLAAAAQHNWKSVLRYNKQEAKAKLTQRFMKYAAQDSQSDPKTAVVPSTKEQLAFAKALQKELKQIGAQNVQLSKTGIVTADIASTTRRPVPTLAFFAHIDTSFDAPAKGVRPQLHSKYNGGDIVINKAQNLRLTEYNSPQLLEAHGHDIVTASGGTLLGADDKTGVAILMTFADYLLGNPNVEHGPIKLVFTPDEETAAGIHTLDVSALQADYGYTVDGSNLGELVNENFSARAFTAVFEGWRSVHPGQAMHTDFADNVLMASDFHTLLPRHRRPETTAGRRGFILVDSIDTEGDRTTVKGIIRAFDTAEMEELTGIVRQSFNTVKSMNPKNKGVSLELEDEYQNAASQLPEILLSTAEAAMRAEDITPKRIAIRGGTDGAQLSYKGLPTADIFAGMYNVHSQLEYADIDVMEASLRTLFSLVQGWLDTEKPTK